MWGSGRRVRILALAMLVLVADGAALADTAKPQKVGELEPLALSTLHPYPADIQEPSQQWIVHHPGATYIRVHFKDFDLAPGDSLIMSNLAGTEIHEYSGRGPHDNGHFWAFSIIGDTAVLKLRAQSGGGFGFQADGFGRGIEPIVGGDPVQPESVCGSQDWEDVNCYNASYPNERANADAVVRALIGCCSGCTAFKVSDSGQFFTNNHCTATQSGVESTELRFYYQRPGCGSGSATYTGSVMGDDLVATAFGLDYTLMTTGGDTTSIPCVGLDPRLPPEGERIYIGHHPAGSPKQLSIESDQNASGLCEVDNSPHNGRFTGSDIGYLCDTTGGSSGSPVFSAVTHKVVGLHHFGGCLNSAGRVDLIWAEIGGMIDECTGSGGFCGNGMVEEGEECDRANLDGASCADIGCGGGTPRCLLGCELDYSTCTECPSCGDATCNGDEDSCSCPQDCGAPPASELGGSCQDGADNDCDGMSDCDDADCLGGNSLDNDADGRAFCEDCDDQDATIWGTPGEVIGLVAGPQFFSWSPPAAPGAEVNALFYDCLRSDDPTDFSAAVCVDPDSPDTQAEDTEVPAPFQVFYYLVRAENTCPALGSGPLGSGANGPRVGVPCP